MGSRDIKKIDKTILDNFYKLVHSQPDVRLTAAASTYKILDAMKKNKSDSFNEHLNYCVDRLVSGLASSRALARQGYGTLLLELLNNYQISTERLLSIAQQKFGNISNETSRDNLLGYFLLVSIILESGNHKKRKANSQQVEKIYKYLMQLKNIKSYFDYPVSKLLTSQYELFHPFLLAEIKPYFFGTDTKVTQTELLIISLCNKKEPLRDFINLDSAGFMNLSSTLLDDRLQRRPLHPIWIEYSKLIIKHLPQQFETFCTSFIFPVFFKPNHNELASMGLEFISVLLDSAENTNQIKSLLNDYVIRLLILSLRNKTTLQKHCIEFFKSLSVTFETTLKGDLKDNLEKHDIHYYILSRFTSAPGSVAFDEDSKSSSICNLLNNSSLRILNKHLDKLMALFNKKFGVEETKRIHLACARQMAHIIRRPQMNDELTTALKLARFLVVNTFFQRLPSKTESDTFWTENCIPKPTLDLDESIRAALRTSYHATMEHIVSGSTLQRIEQFGELVNYSDQLLKLDSIQPVERESSEELTDLWSNYMTCLSKHLKFVKKQKDSKQLLPITNLYYFYGLQIIEHSLDCKTQLQELAQSADEACKGDPNDGSWADVLTDQIIAILSATECPPWIRRFCVSIFGSLLPHISETSIDLLCDVVKAPIEGDEDELSDGEDEDMSTNGDKNVDEEDEEEEELSFDDGETSSEDEDAYYSADNDEDNNDDDDEDKMSVDSQGNENESESINGDEANDSEEDEEYLDDDQMMKMDSVLADMFKLNRVAKKQRKDPSFKLRCLDLMKKVVLKKHNDTEIMKKVLATIVPLATKSRKSAETRPIADKINTLIAKMPGKSKLNGLASPAILSGDKHKH